MISDTHRELYNTACQWLLQQPGWASIIMAIGPCRHLVHPEREPYEALIRAVAYQQLTAKAGDAILNRLRITFQTEATLFPKPRQLIDVDSEILRTCGFSARKVETLKGIAAGALNGLVPLREEAVCMDDDELIARLTSLKGVGRWTVEMLLIYTLERMDIMPLDDFGVVEGLHYLHSPDLRLSKQALIALSHQYAPYRTIVCWYLWRLPQLSDYQSFKVGRVAHG